MFAAPGRVAIDDVPEPKLDHAGDAVVRVSRTAICASDLHFLHGKIPGAAPGAVIGHEFTGEVTDAGDAAGFSPGDRVLGSFLIACGRCVPCTSRAFNLCSERKLLGLGPLNGDLPGAQAEYVRVPVAATNLHVLSPDAQEEQVLFAGDILATGFHAAQLAELRGGENVVVIGGGPVGLMCAIAARAEGADEVIVADLDAQRAVFARDTMGLMSTSASDPRGDIAAATSGAMADVVIDAVGAPAAFKTALKCLRPGGTLVVVGVYIDERYELHLGMAWNMGISIRFSSMANVQASWDRALDRISQGAVDPTAVISHHLPLDEAVRGYELFESRRALKVVLEP